MSATATTASALVSATLIASSPVAMPGQNLWLGVQYDIAPGWHIYWENPGDSGMATSVDLQVQGATVGPLTWPGPQLIPGAGGLNSFGYTDQVTLLMPLKVDRGASGRLQVEGETRWLVCKEDQCIPGTTALSMPLQLGRDVGGDALADARGKLPGPLPDTAKVTRRDNGRALSLAEVGRLELFPDKALEAVLSDWKTSTTAHGSVLDLTLSGPVPADAHAVVAVHTDSGTRYLDWKLKP